MRYSCVLLFTLLIAYAPQAQILSGPMLGPIELRDTRLWVEAAPSVKSLAIRYEAKGKPATAKTIHYNGTLGAEYNPCAFTLGGLTPGTAYTYTVIADGKATGRGGTFNTKPLWQWRTDAPDFTFLTGSCAYFNDRPFDRPGNPYGKDSSIFLTMAGEKADFMLWLGDNWYTREIDYYSRWGLWYRAQKDRREPVLQPLLKAMPHLAIWDDHDFGPNDMSGHYHLKDESKKVFDAYWVNPSSGERGEGNYTWYGHSDVEFFLLDDRWWRAPDAMPDSVNGQPNPRKTMWGATQLDWLERALLHSRATFKIIVTGSQVLNRASPYDKAIDFPVDYHRLINFLAGSKVPGVLIFTGDRHHSEVMQLKRPGMYTLYDITVSPLTSGMGKISGPEATNPDRAGGIALDSVQHYGRVRVTGPKDNRRLTVQFVTARGQQLAEWSVGQKELK